MKKLEYGTNGYWVDTEVDAIIVENWSWQNDQTKNKHWCNIANLKYHHAIVW